VEKIKGTVVKEWEVSILYTLFFNIYACVEIYREHKRMFELKLRAIKSELEAERARVRSSPPQAFFFSFLFPG
jgi:hypothetical protein